MRRSIGEIKAQCYKLARRVITPVDYSVNFTSLIPQIYQRVYLRMWRIYNIDHGS